eukprot:gnl/Chilomastix_cuspidata/5818.p1 GENE.gnl/Chilomastix_cuspidata/5818~~gnl/Chilomastix_cuspidata/5818.p1  ORF type:complete len:591 (+),score=194.26 gnl/Chilomastix_cuspidata/5818:67-1773(+)
MSSPSFYIEGLVLDQHARRSFPGRVSVVHGLIDKIEELTSVDTDLIISPGFVDSHVHIECSMSTPSNFAIATAPSGQIAAIADPHEIANVCGVDGVRYMIVEGRRAPTHLFWAVPSCVPCLGAPVETAGGAVTAAQFEALLDEFPRELVALGEYMDFPGVLAGDAKSRAFLGVARRRGLPVDGHAPGLRGADAAKYFGSGISTDHECTSLAEALEKVRSGAAIMLREGSAAKDLDTLAPLFDDAEARERLLFCTDDSHSRDVARGMIAASVARALSTNFGARLFPVLRAACANPVRHYNLAGCVGTLRAGDPADFIVLSGPLDAGAFRRVRDVYVGGVRVASDGAPCAPPPPPLALPRAVAEHFDARRTCPDDFAIRTRSAAPRVEVLAVGHSPGTLFTRALRLESAVVAGILQPPDGAVKLAVISRYKPARPAVAFLVGFAMPPGAAIASTLSHDCHNIVVAGNGDAALSQAANALIDAKGGICVVEGGRVNAVPLGIAGLMSSEPWDKFVARFCALQAAAVRATGGRLASPFLSLSFLALPVIPEVKLTDRGLFDVRTFKFVAQGE